MAGCLALRPSGYYYWLRQCIGQSEQVIPKELCLIIWHRISTGFVQTVDSPGHHSLLSQVFVQVKRFIKFAGYSFIDQPVIHMKNLLLLAGSFFSINLLAQPMPLPYVLRQIPLPAAMDKQVCLSGMKYMDGMLYFASERCPIIIVTDPATGEISRTINTQVPQEFEMEGLTSYKNKLYGVSENIVAVYEIDPVTGQTRQISTSVPLPPKSRSGDGMEGIAANETNNRFYILRERNEDMTFSQIWTFSIEPGSEDNSFSLKYESTIELPLANSQWRYSDICYDRENDRLLCLKSYSKGKLRQQFIEAIEIDQAGDLKKETLKDLKIERFSEISNEYKDQGYSMNLEGITVDKDGNIWVVSDNTSGKAHCDLPAKEKTILVQLVKK